MIGIYKITNKLNGKSYIGQSIHCGKRLDEHCKGSQFIDEIIQLEGIENFTFEILKEVLKDELSYWEDYYILRCQTYFPKGYNKKWNCSLEVRNKLKKQIDDEKKQGQEQETDFLNSFFKKIKYSDCIYAWLLLHSYNNEIENYNYIYKKDCSYTNISKDICKTRQTTSTRFNLLLKNKIINEDEYNNEKIYKIIFFNSLKKIDNTTISKLLYFSSNYQVEELIKVYFYFLTRTTPFLCSCEKILKDLGHSASHKKDYDRMRKIIEILQDAGIIKFRTLLAKQNEKGEWIGTQMEVYEINKKASDEWLGQTEKENSSN